MKQLFAIIIAVICLNVSASAGSFSRADLVASGLTCSMCSNSIYKALIKLPFVANVSPDVEHSSFRIEFRAGVPMDIDALQQTVKGAGFSVDKLTLTLSMHQVPVHNDLHQEIDGLTFHFVHVPSETLNGEVTIRVIDKGFLPAKEYKQYATYTTMPCFATGRMASTRIFHVTI